MSLSIYIYIYIYIHEDLNKKVVSYERQTSYVRHKHNDKVNVNKIMLKKSKVTQTIEQDKDYIYI